MILDHLILNPFKTHKTTQKVSNFTFTLLRQLAFESTHFWVNSLLCQLAFEATSFWGNSLLRQLAFEATRFQGKSLLRQLAFEATHFSGNSLLRQHAFEVTRFWGNSLSRQLAFEATRFWGNSLLRQLAFEANHFWGNSLSRQITCLFVCYYASRRDADVFANYTGTILQVSIINSSTRSTLPTGLGQNPTRGPTATHHLSLPGLRYQTLLTTCQTSSPVEVWHMRVLQITFVALWFFLT
jgi:hypothetical protein